ncbi:MAG: hypothetical protein Q7W29_02705 [bacterium]|nr:hypothetical protein [bacterium]
MKKSIAVITIALTVLGSGAAAQISPCPDAIGVYFDLDASRFSTTYPGGFAPLDVYLILTHPTGDYIRSWECRINEANNFTLPGVWTVIGGTDTDGDPSDFVVTMDGCPVAASINVLASKRMYGAAPGAGSYAVYQLAGIPGSTSFPNGDPGYVHTPGINTPLQAAIGFVGNSEYPQAWVNASFESWIACQTANPNFGVNARAVLDGMLDYDNWAGAFSRAWDGFDGQYDLPEPPPSPDGFVSLAIPHPEWNASVGDDFKTDTRSLYDPVHYAKTWPLRLSSSSSGLATLSFQPDFGQSSGWGLTLIDDDEGQVIDLWDSLSLTVNVVSGEPRNFRLVVGLLTATGAPEIPSDRFALRAVPNPFNPRTEIVLTLPRAGRAEVRIHDVQGRLVKRLGAIDGVAGENRVTWLGADDRGRDVASGVYFATLRVDGAASGAVVRLSLVR